MWIENPPQRYAAIMMNRLPQSWAPPGSHVVPFDYYGLEWTWVESTDPTLEALARSQPFNQCYRAGTRDQVKMDVWLCVDHFRIGVRPDLLQACKDAANGGTAQDMAAAIQALATEAQF